MGTFELPLGQTLSAEMINEVLARTTVIAATKERGQWGVGQRFFLEGPPGRLNEAMELVQRLMAEPVGGDGNGDGNGDDEPCPHPKGSSDAWSEEAERRLDDALRQQCVIETSRRGTSDGGEATFAWSLFESEWKSNFGHPTPSTRRCPLHTGSSGTKDAVCSKRRSSTFVFRRARWR